MEGPSGPDTPVIPRIGLLLDALPEAVITTDGQYCINGWDGAAKRLFRLTRSTMIGAPPTRLGYLCHLRRDRGDATEVEIQFIDRGGATTRVEIEHRGWEALGAEGETWSDRNHCGWATLLPHSIQAAGTTPR